MKRFCFYSGVFLVTSSTLMLQVVQTRILSVVAWYYLAFFVISIAMFGLTAGSVWVYLRRDRFTDATLSYDLTLFSGAFALTTALSLAVQMTLAPVVVPVVSTVVIWAELALCMAVPFFFSGVVISLALTRSPYPVGRVYGVDLAGAAIGCLGILALLNHTDGPTAVLWTAAMIAAAAVLFSGSGIGAAPRTPSPFGWLGRRPMLLFLALVLCALANGATSHGLRPLFVKGMIDAADERRLFEEWNSFSRVVVFESPQKDPHMWGPSPDFDGGDWSIEQRDIILDGAAGTTTYRIDGDAKNAEFLKYDVTNLAYFLPDRERAGIIGVGGGRDMLSARVFGVPDVTGVEINPILVRLLTDEPGYAEFSGMRRLDGMTFVVDEARSWFARTEQTFDVIQMSLIDTWAATGAGAYTLSENGLYTVEAWRVFLNRLTPEGVFTVSRWYDPNEDEETGRMISLAMAALFDLGATDPRRHIFVATSDRIATLVLSRSPLPPSAVAILEAVADDLSYDVLISPNADPASPVLRRIVASGDRAGLDRYTANLRLDLTPSTDERPFFFNQLPLDNPWKTVNLAVAMLAEGKKGVASGNLFATATLVLLFAVSAALVLATIVIPLRPAIRDVGRRLAFGGTVYFFLIGVGFMSTEIGLLQRMSVFLGHPIYALSIVLFSIILATGIGSLISDKLPLDTPGKFTLWATLIGGYLFALPFWLPGVLLAFESAALPARAALCVLTIAPAGLLMGFGFPTGMRMISAVDRKPTPWFWGINGAAGVLASILAVACSIAFGISTTLIIGALCYLCLIPAALAIGFRAEAADANAPRAFRGQAPARGGQPATGGASSG
jgi:SAM-dependent methyltransferase